MVMQGTHKVRCSVRVRHGEVPGKGQAGVIQSWRRKKEICRGKKGRSQCCVKQPVKKGVSAVWSCLREVH